MSAELKYKVREALDKLFYNENDLELGSSQTDLVFHRVMTVIDGEVDKLESVKNARAEVDRKLAEFEQAKTNLKRLENS
jgi:hypothetical protein